MPITRIYLIRHGATILTAEDRFAGATNVPLSDEGRHQAATLAHRLRPFPIAALYASPLDRTMETARILAGPHELEVNPRDGLREISHGHWEQLTRHEVEQQFPKEAAAWDEDPYTFAPEGGESGLAVTARALPDLMDIVRHHEGQSIIVVSHKATIRLVLCSLLGTPYFPAIEDGILFVLPRIVYGDPAVARLEGDRLVALGNEAPEILASRTEPRP